MEKNQQNYINKLNSVLLFILQSFPRGIDYIRLFKILYYAQQEHLVKYSVPLVNVAFEGDKHGPVPLFLQKTLQDIEGGAALDISNSNILASVGVKTMGKIHYVYAKDMSLYNSEWLSETNMQVLNKYIENFRDMKSYDISQLSHEDKAWQTAYARRKDNETPIMFCDEIAEAGGASPYILSLIRNTINNRLFL